VVEPFGGEGVVDPFGGEEGYDGVPFGGVWDDGVVPLDGGDGYVGVVDPLGGDGYDGVPLGGEWDDGVVELDGGDG
jgi:hypothetical protein